MSATCQFVKSWIGVCGKPLPCEEHTKLNCDSCGSPAVMDCYETMGQWVCGRPLCGECEHTTQSNGCNSMGELPPGLGYHCKKDAQVYKPWYALGPGEVQP